MVDPKTHSPPPMAKNYTLISYLRLCLSQSFNNSQISPMICQVLIVFSILAYSSGAVAGEGATTAYDVFLFNCGATSDNVDGSGRNWKAENQKILPSNSDKASFCSDALYQESGVPQVPYMEARIFRSDFTYSFPVSRGWKFLRLYFYPTQYKSGFDAVNTFFSVTVNDITLLRNFSADLTAQASLPRSKSLIKEFIVRVDQTLNLTFTPSSPQSLAFVNGIEIVSMPDRFYSKGGFDGIITNVGSNVEFQIDNLTAFETVYRLNVGGQMVDEVSDSRMFRRWLSDDDDNIRFGDNMGIVPNKTNVKIKYTEKTPAYVAPENVYATCRVMGNVESPEANLNFNLTWLFPVDAGFTYLVRLHFCEILPEVDSWNQRVFTIFIRNQVAKYDMDVFHLSGGRWIAMYLDFSIYVVDDGTSKRPNLRVDLHPYKDAISKYYDAILNGVEILKLNNSEGNLAGPNPDPLVSPDLTSNHLTRPGKGKTKSHLLPITLAVILVMFLVVVIILLMRRRKKNKNEFSVNTTSKPTTDSSWTPLPHGTGSTNTRSTISLPSDICRRFSISEIKAATNDFEEKLIVGLGGYGPVYKGRIDDGSTLVAVKRLGTSSNQGVKEFEAELKMLSVLRHLHLVSLIGYCDDEDEMVLVYEYMPRGTLKDHIYKRDKGSDPPLSWKRRLEICIGAARGLQYLHTGAKHPIIHRDIKTTNILLDENFVAKVSDFGLSRIGPTSASQTHVSTVVKGTFGYLDPEYYRRQVLTEKSDVYSFGVVLFEVLCCRPIKMQTVPPEQADLIRWVKSNYKKGTVDQIIDQDLTADITSTSLEKFCEIAVRCVENRGVERPSMNDVVWALEFALQLHETAKKKNDNMDSLDLMPRGEVGTTTDGEDALFSTTTGHVAISTTTTDDSLPLIRDDKSGSSWGVFSEIRDPKAR